MNLNDKKIAILVPFYIGGGAEKITDTIFRELIHRYGYSVQLISVKMNEHTRPRAEAIGYEIADLSEKGPDFNSSDAETALLDTMKKSNAKHIVFVGVVPEHIERYRKELKERNIIFHLHTMPKWEPIVKLLSTRRYVLALDSASKYIEWYFVKYLKEKLLGVYTKRLAQKYRRIYNNVDSIIALTDSYRKELCDMIKVPTVSGNTKIATIYNPFDPTGLQSVANHPKNKEILYLGRFHCIEKGVDNLLRVWKIVSQKHPDWTLKLVGEGPDKGYLDYLIDSLNLTGVKFFGYSQNIAEHFATAPILCLPSNVDGWPTVLIEAMSAGVVPVAFRCSGGVQEMLAGGRGVLVTPGDIKQMANGICSLIENPDKLDEHKKHYPVFVKSFSVDQAVNKFTELLK